MTRSIGSDAPGWRPRVRMNVAESADGKIAPVDGGKINFGSVEDRARMEELRCAADAVLIGGGTLRAEDPPLLIRDPAAQARRRAAKGAPHPRNVTVCSTLPEHLGRMNFFTHGETEKIVFTTEKTPAAARAAAAERARVEVVPLTAAGRVDLVEVVRRLKAMGVEELLLEGGGELNFSMLALGLVDEVFLTVCPFVFGGRDAPTPCDGEGFPRDQVKTLSLRDHRLGSFGELFLHYDVLSDPVRVGPNTMFGHGYQVNR